MNDQDLNSGGEPVSVDALTAMFQTELDNDSDPEGKGEIIPGEAPAKQARAPRQEIEDEEPETAEIEDMEPEEADPEAEDPDDEDSDEDDDSEGDPDEDQDDDDLPLPVGMSEADRAMFRRATPEVRQWLTKQAEGMRTRLLQGTTEIKQTRKAVETERGQLLERMQQYDQGLAQLQQRIAPKRPDPALREYDPDGYELAWQQYEHGMAELQHIERERTANAEQMQKAQAEATERFMREQAEELQIRVPELFQDRAKADALKKYALDMGVPPEQLPRASAMEWEILWKAQQYDQARTATKAAKTSKPKQPAPKTAKPGPAKAPGKGNRRRRAASEFARKPTVDNLAAAYLAELESD